MDSPLRQSASANKISIFDVGQLDKINAIPNKATDNVLMDNLCQEDQLYLSALMDEDSSDSDTNMPDDRGHHHHRHLHPSNWSPMMQSPMVMKKRMKRLRPSYTITLSLEDISYIRPSWGISKGIRKLSREEVRSKRGKSKWKKSNPKSSDGTTVAAVKTTSDSQEANPEGSGGDKTAARKTTFGGAYQYFLASLVAVFLFIMLLSYQVDNFRYNRAISEYKFKLSPRYKSFEIYKPTRVIGHTHDENQNNQQQQIRALKVLFGQGIPNDLKFDECTCQTYDQETARHTPANKMGQNQVKGHCVACLDWAMRANLQIRVQRNGQSASRLGGLYTGDVNADEKTDKSPQCYHVSWQSYDTLATPLVDCFELQDRQWLGLGDHHTAQWPLERLNFNSSQLIMANLGDGEFPPQVTTKDSEMVGGEDLAIEGGGPLVFGSHAEFTLFSSAGIHVGKLKSDFGAALETMVNPTNSSARLLCISAKCRDTCGTEAWPSSERRFETLEYRNNFLDYTICSDFDLGSLVSAQLGRSVTRLALGSGSASSDSTTQLPLAKSARLQHEVESSSPLSGASSYGEGAEQMLSSAAATESIGGYGLSVLPGAATSSGNGGGGETTRQPPQAKKLPEGISLIERTIFATSAEFLPQLDGQTLRAHVDNIVKLGLKIRLALLIDTRWQTHVGSLELHNALFPKKKILFDILHNKGFKIILTLKPYIDASIGMSNINQLVKANRILTTSHPKAGGATSIGASQITLGVVNENQFPMQRGDAQQMAVRPSYASSISHRAASVLRRRSLFKFERENVTLWSDSGQRMPYLYRCKESQEGFCVLLDLVQARNRLWLIEAIRGSHLLTQEADALLLSGAHPDPLQWADSYRDGFGLLVDELFYKEKLFVMPQWTGNFGYIQLAPRALHWGSLRSTLSSVLNLGACGYSIIHPGSVWGDLKWPASTLSKTFTSSINTGLTGTEETSEEELVHRWLQLAVFMPVLQFNNLEPIRKFNLQDVLQNLVRVRRLVVVPELKRHLPFTPLVPESRVKMNSSIAAATTSNSSGGGGGLQDQLLPLIRPIWMSNESGDTIVSEQFSIGPDLLVAPILRQGQRQKDIYLPSGFWQDELRKTTIRGGKWLRNYPVELNEIAWFTRARR